MCLSCKGFICIFFKTQSSQIGTFPRLESIVAYRSLDCFAFWVHLGRQAACLLPSQLLVALIQLLGIEHRTACKLKLCKVRMEFLMSFHTDLAFDHRRGCD